MVRLFGFLIVVLFGSNVWAADLSEQDKINGLLNALNTSDITFIRNGEEHDGTWAKKHLEDKLKAANPPINTAEEFIVDIASASIHTGKPYLIKTKDGNTVEANKWLHMKLAEMTGAKP